eukprot:NODE_606_length_6171_cov_0.294466.p3 type:complete len:182 gc:universal NODE_606_length_6171_cov_0.294466:2980-2435(-)
MKFLCFLWIQHAISISTPTKEAFGLHEINVFKQVLQSIGVEIPENLNTNPIKTDNLSSDGKLSELKKWLFQEYALQLENTLFQEFNKIRNQAEFAESQRIFQTLKDIPEYKNLLKGPEIEQTRWKENPLIRNHSPGWEPGYRNRFGLQVPRNLMILVGRPVSPLRHTVKPALPSKSTIRGR